MDRKLNVLLVDDSRTVLAQLERILGELEGVAIVGMARNGAAAIRMTTESSPDLVLMDIVMPGVNGFQATRELASDPETRTIPVIMISSKSQESDRVWGLRQGAVDYLVKPVSAEKLVRKAQAALAA